MAVVADDSGDLALDELTTAEVKLREHVESFRRTALRDARRIIHFIMPTKLEHLNGIVKTMETWTSTDISRMAAYVKPPAAKVDKAAAGGAVSDLPPAKRARSESAAVDEDDSDLSSVSSGGAGVIYAQAVPANPHVVELSNKIKQELMGLVDICNKVKIAIQLSIPRIEDGNNFGVSIQEDTIAELGRAEDSAFVMLDSIAKYYMARAKLSTKCIKYPNVVDYQHAISQLDEKELANLRLCAADLRNNVAILYDVIVKNLDRIKKPRSSNATSMY